MTSAISHHNFLRPLPEGGGADTVRFGGTGGVEGGAGGADVGVGVGGAAILISILSGFVVPHYYTLYCFICQYYLVIFIKYFSICEKGDGLPSPPRKEQTTERQ
jgi:hypothetical protein